MPRRLAVFGAYSDDDLYQRNRTLVKIFAELSQETIYLRPASQGSGHGFSSGKSAFTRLKEILSDVFALWKQRSLLRNCDTVFVPYPAYLDVLALWVSGYSREKLVIVDAFLELHSTVVEDRKLIPSRSLRARLLKSFQKFTLGKADLVLIDTSEQAALMSKQLSGTGTHVAAVPVGIDESIWTEIPCPDVTDRLSVLFWGTFIPLHGVEHIVAAARILESRGVDVDFQLIGDGQEAQKISSMLSESMLRSLRWERRLVDTATLREAVTNAHIVLGIFGESAKSASVIPYKVHQSLASGRPTITREGPAMASLGSERQGLILCPPGDPIALAALIEDTAARLRDGWAPRPRILYDENLGNTVIRERLAAAIVSAKLEIAEAIQSS